MTSASKRKPRKRKAAKPARKPGRPSSFTQRTADLICALLSEGQSLRRICESPSMPSKQTVLTWLASPERAPFLAQYVRAREAQADYYAEEIIEISDDDSGDIKKDLNGNERMDAEFVGRSRLRVDTRKWLMARMAPKKYGDRVALTGADGGAVKHETEVTIIELVAEPIPAEMLDEPAKPDDDEV